MITLENCPICSASDWHSLDYLRDQSVWYQMDLRYEDEPVGFKVCKDCGFLTYDYVSDERLKKHYTHSRPMMNARLVATCNRKIAYHLGFIHDIKIGKRVLEVGCAQGYFLKYLKDQGHEVHGTEWAETMRHYGQYEWGIPITEEIDESMIYDFICYYHVIEHVQNPDKELQKIKRILADDGLLYLSIPYWGDFIEISDGTPAFGFEELYHLNHMNCFSLISFRNLLKRQGFKITKENYDLYGYTVLCEKCEPSDDIEKEDWKQIVSNVTNHREAILKLRTPDAPEGVLNVKDWAGAKEYCKKFPDLYVFQSVTEENLKDYKKQIAVLEEGLKHSPNNLKIILQMARTYFQWDENTPDKQGYYGNNIRKAEKLLLEYHERKRGNEEALYFLAHIELKHKKDYSSVLFLFQ